MSRIFLAVVRGIGWLALILYLVMAVLILGMRYWVIPHIDDYQPLIESRLSAWVGAPVRLGAVSARLDRSLHLDLADVGLSDAQGHKVLAIPQVNISLSWRRLLSDEPGFMSVQARGVELELRRDTQGAFWLLGQRFEPEGLGADTTASTWPMLMRQPYLEVRDARLRWTDDTRGGAPLTLENVNITMLHRQGQHTLSFTARAAQPVGGQVRMHAEFAFKQNAAAAILPAGEGRLYVELDTIDPERWRAWVPFPESVSAKQASARAWMEQDDRGAVQLSADVHADFVQWHRGEQLRVISDKARFIVHSPWQQARDLTDYWHALADLPNEHESESLRYGVQASGIQLFLDAHYDEPLRMDSLRGHGRLRSGTHGPELTAQDVRLRNGDIKAHVGLQWRSLPDDRRGYIDAQAQVDVAALPAVHRYMPKWVDEGVRAWLHDALLAGQVRDAHVVLKGPFANFPFSDKTEDGEFSITGPFSDAVLDYVPDSQNAGTWPRLEGVQGHLRLYGSSLEVYADTATVHSPKNQLIALHHILARIGNMQHDTVVDVTGSTQAAVSSYLSFLRHSPVGGMLGHAFDAAQGEGEWRVPLELSIPLAQPEHTKVLGKIITQDSSFHLDPRFPGLEGVHGTLAFDQTGAYDVALQAHLLNQSLALAGDLRADRGEGLRLSGEMDAQALGKLIPVRGMKRFSGKAAYVARLQRQQAEGRAMFKLALESDLQGVGMAFPEPLQKDPDEAWPSSMQWSFSPSDEQRSVDLRLAGDRRVQLRGGPQSAEGSYFQQGVMSVGHQAKLPDHGFRVEIETPTFDADAWDDIVEEFTTPDSDTPAAAPVFPRLYDLRVQAHQARFLGGNVDDLTYTIRRTSEEQWRIDVSSAQTAGTVRWQEQGGQVQGPVQAVFQRLALGRASDDSPSESASDTSFSDKSIDVAAVNLSVDALSLLGRPVGKLVLAAFNEEQGARWRLDQISLTSPSAHLEGQGVWQTQGKNRGLTLEAKVDVSDLGAYAEQIGFPDVLSEGAGELQASIRWRDLPWSLSMNHLDGHIQFEFSKGRLSTVNSRSARLLELLSLQSMRRLASLDINPANLTKEGFPYDVLRGSLTLKEGQLTSDDYRVIGPIGTIVLEGQVALGTGDLDLRAAVVPNLDVSGAALAAGIAVSPVVGVAAFLTQWLLKAPLAQAMTAQYRITGDWDDPIIDAIDKVPNQSTPN